MPEKARAFLKQLTDFWASLPTPKRIALVLVMTTVLVGVMTVSVLGSRETYGTLYSELATEDAAAIVAKLKTAQVPYRLESNGTAIQVPEERIPGLRLELASAGLPHGGSVGFEIFDHSKIGATEFEQQVNLRRALEGELARSVMSIDGVKNARVHLVLPERRLFAAREESASASVVVKLENSHNFSRKEVAAVVHLVAAAVPTLSKDRVSVVSTEGVTLHRPTSDTQAGGDLADLNAEQARVMAGQLEADAQAQLERVLGPGNADVRVNLWLDNAARERTEELYEPTKTALRSEHKVEEGVANGDAGVAGVPGAKTNLPDAQGEGPVAEEKPAGGAGTGAVRSQTRNWEVQKVVQKTLTPAGDIRRLSVAVLLNGRYNKKGVFAPIPQDEVKALEETVKRAVGFNQERGDTVMVQATRFAKLDSDDMAAPVSFFTNKPWLPYAMAAGALVLVLGTLVMVLRTKKPLPAPAPPAMVDPLRVLAELESGQERAEAAASLPEAERQRLLQEPEVAGEIRAHALELAAKDPATAAVVLKAWLSEEPAALPASSAA
ncbi:MAG TPA: flagellar basal-body MS-ring/collar protein FliF [Polyangiaceae bacterium]|nr:flagellar basal-body MS-ring/collar protein FliF [Polyangiaceae bacterium]